MQETMQRTTQELIDQLNADDMLSRFGAYYTTRIQIICDDDIYHFEINSGQVSKGDSGALDEGFSLTGSKAVWAKYFEDVPPPEHHEFAALLANGHISAEGDIYAMQSNVMYVRRLLELWRNDQRRNKQD
jgi:hypothetical protein